MQFLEYRTQAHQVRKPVCVPANRYPLRWLSSFGLCVAFAMPASNSPSKFINAPDTPSLGLVYCAGVFAFNFRSFARIPRDSLEISMDAMPNDSQRRAAISREMVDVSWVCTHLTVVCYLLLARKVGASACSFIRRARVGDEVTAKSSHLKF